MERIRVTVTEVYEYTPNLESDFYVDKGISSIDKAAQIDLEHLRKGEVGANELADEPTSVGFHLEIFDDGIE